MPAILANASKFLLNSDYPIDKIIYLKEASYTIGAGVDITIPHGLSFTPLPMLQWSYDPDFDTAYENNTGPFPSGVPGIFFSMTVAIEADSTNIVLRGGGVAAPTTVYVRIFCFPPHDYTGEAPSTASLGDNFVLNFEKNYMKLIDSGKVDVASMASSTITHDLGVYPHVLVWNESSIGTVYPESVSYPGVNPYTEVTTSQLVFRNDDILGDWTFHYRMYNNE